MRGTSQRTRTTTGVSRDIKVLDLEMIRQLFHIGRKRLEAIAVQSRIGTKIAGPIGTDQNVVTRRVRQEKGISRQEHGVKRKNVGTVFP
jgi:hypothetical protein